MIVFILGHDITTPWIQYFMYLFISQFIVKRRRHFGSWPDMSILVIAICIHETVENVEHLHGAMKFTRSRLCFVFVLFVCLTTHQQLKSLGSPRFIDESDCLSCVVMWAVAQVIRALVSF